MHQHGGLGVPVGLGADVDARHDQIDLAAPLREFHQPAQHAADPVHVLGAAVHGDPGAPGNRKPFERHPHLAGEVEGGHDPPALGLGQGAHAAAGIAEQDHPRHPLGVAGSEIADDPHHDVGLVAAVRPVDGEQTAGGVEVVLDEFAGGEVGGGLALRRGQPLDHLVGVGEPAPPQVDHLLGVLPQRLQGGLRGLADAQDHS